jgi:hypothetical protein
MLRIQLLNKQKYITSKDNFGIFPLGKSGDEFKFETITGSKIIFTYGMSINDSDRRNVITCIAYALARIGFEQIEQIRYAPLSTMKNNGQMAFTTFEIKSSEISTKLYGTSKEGRQIVKSLKKIVHILVDIDDTNNTFTQIQNVAYKNGYIVFDFANILINHLASIRLIFDLEQTLLHSGFDYRLSFYIATHQYGIKNKNQTKWYPKQVYHLCDLIHDLHLQAAYLSQPRRTIQQIEKAFNNLHSKNTNFPIYIYDNQSKFFYNKYKKNANLELFK